MLALENKPKPTITASKWTFNREHLYRNSNGEVVAKKVVYNTPDGKQTPWKRQEQGEWLNGLTDEVKTQIPLYHIPELLAAETKAINNEPLFFAEGEKDCETLEKMGFVATSTRNGGGMFPQWNDIKRFVGNFSTVIIITDNDPTGEKYGHNALKTITDREVFVIDTSEIYNYIVLEIRQNAENFQRNDEIFDNYSLQLHDDISDLVKIFGAEVTKKALNRAVDERYRFGNSEKYEDLLKLTSDTEQHSKRRADRVTHTDPERAARAGQKFYKLESIDTNTQEHHFRILPIFAVFEDKKLRINAGLLLEFFHISHDYIFVRNHAMENVMRFIYQNGVYKLISDDEVKGIMQSYIEKFGLKLKNQRVVADAFELFKQTSEVYVDYDQINTDENIINFQNGILHLGTMRLSPHSPKILSTIQIPCQWNNSSQDTPVFDKYISTLANCDVDTIQLLLEFIGASLSNVFGYRFKKSLFMVGAGNTGKSVLLQLVGKMLGNQNYSERSLKALNDRFGETAVYLKRLVYSPDLSFVKVDEMDKFKQLTGGDSISIEYKGKTPFNYRYKGLLWFTMNELPLFGGDKGSHVYDRIIPVKCNNVIPIEQQDSAIVEKLFAEREGIITKCVAALIGAIKNNYRFTEPETVKATRSEYMRENSQPLEFWNECVETRKYGETYKNTVSEVYRAFSNWNTQNGNHYTPSLKEFRKEVASAFKIPIDEMVTKIGLGWIFTKFKLNNNGKQFI